MSEVEDGAKAVDSGFQAAREEVKLWNLVLRKKRGARVSGRYFERQVKICKQADALSLSLEEVVERQKRAYRAEIFLAKVSEASRKSWLELLCEAKAEAGEGSKEIVLRRLIRIEDQWKNARIIGRVNGKLQSGSVTSVVAPNEDGEWVEVVGKEGIEKALLEGNERQFNQAKVTGGRGDFKWYVCCS